MQLMHNFGADANRWYLMAVSPPWIPTKFDKKGVQEIQNKFFGTLKNVYSFYVTYANIDKFDASEYEISNQKKAEIDRWIISRLNSLIKTVTLNMNNYDLTRSVRALQSFVIDDLSNWYVRRSRRRYWAMQLTEDKKAAYLTLYQVLVAVSKLMAPIAPYLSEEIHANLCNDNSVHLQDFPKIDEDVINEKLEAEMQTTIDIVSLGRAARNKCQIKVRQTLQALHVPVKYKEVVTRMAELIKEEINVKEINFVKDDADFVNYDVKPNFKVMGPKYGKHMKAISGALKEIDGSHIVNTLNAGKEYYLELEGSTFKISEEDILVSIEDRNGFVFESDKEKYVALDTNLTPQLIKEGLARELVNKIQFTRKEKDFDIMDRIEIEYSASEQIQQVFRDYADYIKAETLTDEIKLCEQKNDMEKWNINKIDVYYKIKRNRSKNGKN
jgi:isoleucyl-tRNA synthetase